MIVHNLSDLKLTQEELQVLNKGHLSHLISKPTNNY